MTKEQDAAAEAAEVEAVADAVALDIVTPEGGSATLYVGGAGGGDDPAVADDVLRILAPTFRLQLAAVERLPQTPNVEQALNRLRDLVDISSR